MTLRKVFRQLRLAIAMVTEGKRARVVHIIGWCIWIIPGLLMFLVWWLFWVATGRNDDWEEGGYHG